MHMRDPISCSSLFIRSRRHRAIEKASWLVLICWSLFPYSTDIVGVDLMEGVPPDLEPDLPFDPLKAKSVTLLVNKFESEVKSLVIKGSSDVSKSKGPRSGVNLVDSLLDVGCDAISIENKGLGLTNGSEGAVMGSKISSKVVMADISGSLMVNHVIRNPIKEDEVIEGFKIDQGISCHY
ncbi:unnamed protein product [Lactuca saligna]|uniref:Uncharacterized protein n=1 Tax=Lactuca saligna TaxID=75948 RepID=A0AA35V3Q9_LACSI|nr:unnamed protein product [Lactuca saligna]